MWTPARLSELRAAAEKRRKDHYRRAVVNECISFDHPNERQNYRGETSWPCRESVFLDDVIGALALLDELSDGLPLGLTGRQFEEGK